MMYRTGIILAFIVAAAMMAYQIGARLSDEALMTLVGVLCGIAATVPISIGLLIALTRDRDYYAPADSIDLDAAPAPEPYNIYRPAVTPSPPPLPPQPQVIVVAPAQAQLPPHLTPYPNYLLPPPTDAYSAPMQERNFKIVGEQEGE